MRKEELTPIEVRENRCRLLEDKEEDGDDKDDRTPAAKRDEPLNRLLKLVEKRSETSLDS